MRGDQFRGWGSQPADLGPHEMQVSSRIRFSLDYYCSYYYYFFFGFQMPRDAGRATRGARSQPAVTKRCRCVARSTRFPGTASGSRGRTTGRSVTCCQCQTRKLGTTGSLAFSSTLPPLTPTSELSRAGRATASEDKGRLVYSTSWLEVRVLDNSKLTLFLNGLFFFSEIRLFDGYIKTFIYIYIFRIYIW